MRRTPGRGAPHRRGPPRAGGRHAPHARSPTLRRSPEFGPDAPPPRPPPRGDRRRGRRSHRRDGLAPAGIAPPMVPAVPNRRSHGPRGARTSRRARRHPPVGARAGGDCVVHSTDPDRNSYPVRHTTFEDILRRSIRAWLAIAILVTAACHSERAAPLAREAEPEGLVSTSELKVTESNLYLCTVTVFDASGLRVGVPVRYDVASPEWRASVGRSRRALALTGLARDSTIVKAMSYIRLDARSRVKTLQAECVVPKNDSTGRALLGQLATMALPD